MTKRVLRLLAMAALAIGLLSFTVDWMVPDSPVAHAAGEARSALSSAGPAEVEVEAVPLARSARLVAIVIGGLVCVLFGVIAISPLLLDDSARSR